MLNIMEAVEGKLDVRKCESGTEPRGGVIHCDPCESEGRYSQAKGFCTECNDYLCSECYKIHRRPILWRYHELRDEQSMPKMKSAKVIKEECIEPCAKHPKRIIEYFCHTHMKLACSLCVFRDHRYCANVVFIPDVAGRNSESEELDVLSGKFANVLEDIEIQKSLTKRSLAVVDEMQKKAEGKIQMLKTEICSFLDKLREDIVLINHSDNINLEACSNSFNGISKRIKTCVTILEKKRKEGKMSQLFVDLKLSKLTLKDVIKDVEETKALCKMQQFDVDIDDSIITEIQKCLTKICVSVRPPMNKEEGGSTLKDCDSTEVREAGKSTQLEFLAEHVDDTSVTHSKEEEVEGAVYMLEHKEMQIKAEANILGIKTDTRNEIEGNCSPSYPISIRQYDREVLMKLQTSAHALRKPVGILDVPDIVFNEPQEFYLRWMKATTETKQQGMYNLRPNYVWGHSNTKKEKKAGCNEMSTGDSKPQVVQIPVMLSKQKAEDDRKAAKTTEMLQMPVDKEVIHAGSKIPCVIKGKLYSLIVKEKQDDHSIIEWIESNVDKTRKSGTAFVNVLVVHVCKFSCEKDGNGGLVFYPEKIWDRKRLLLKYIDNNLDLELEAIHAVQNFVEKYKHPPGLLREALDVLKAAGIISDRSFFKLKEAEKEKEAPQKCSKVPPKIKKMLYALIVKEMRDDQCIIDWIESNVDDSLKSETSFVNDLVNKVCMFSSEKDDEGNWTFHPKSIREKKELLCKYLSNVVDLELQALYAVQVNIEKFKHPPCVLREAFVVLYGSGIISKDAFFKWETSEDKPDIRDECLKQTVPFFTWLLAKDGRK